MHAVFSYLCYESLDYVLYSVSPDKAILPLSVVYPSSYQM